MPSKENKGVETLRPGGGVGVGWSADSRIQGKPTRPDCGERAGASPETSSATTTASPGLITTLAREWFSDTLHCKCAEVNVPGEMRF